MKTSKSTLVKETIDQLKDAREELLAIDTDSNLPEAIEALLDEAADSIIAVSNWEREVTA